MNGKEGSHVTCVDGLVSFPDAIKTGYPNVRLQLCIVHLPRNSLKYVPWNYCVKRLLS